MIEINKELAYPECHTFFSHYRKQKKDSQVKKNQFVREIIFDKINEKDYILEVENKMLTKTMKIEDNMIFIPELEKYKGKEKVIKSTRVSIPGWNRRFIA